MRTIVALLFLSVIGLAVARPGGTYTIKYDNIDLNEILKSDRLTENYVNCLLDLKSCSTDGSELKKILPDALKTNCEKCSEKQKEGAKLVIQHLYKNKTDWWTALEKKYDPEGTYVQAHKAELEAL